MNRTEEEIINSFKDALANGDMQVERIFGVLNTLHDTTLTWLHSKEH